MRTTVNIRLLVDGTKKTVSLHKQLANVDAIYLDEVLAVGWNAGVATAGYVRLVHHQLRDASITDNGQEGTMILVDPLYPHDIYQSKLMSTGTAATLQTFEVSVNKADGTPVVFTELSLILSVISRHPVPGAYQRDAAVEWPQTKGADPRQSKFMY